MKDIAGILSEYEDFELAALWYYKSDTYLPETKEKIQKYLLEKGLDGAVVDQIIKDLPNKIVAGSEPHCPRCKSTKLLCTTVELTDTSSRSFTNKIAFLDGYLGKKKIVDQVVCSICNYVIEDPNDEQLKKPWYRRLF